MIAFFDQQSNDKYSLYCSVQVLFCDRYALFRICLDLFRRNDHKHFLQRTIIIIALVCPVFSESFKIVITWIAFSISIFGLSMDLALFWIVLLIIFASKVISDSCVAIAFERTPQRMA